VRTRLQAMADRLLLLYAIAVGNKAGKVDGPFKLMKIPFMAELASTRDGVNTFNYSFYRWTYGPMTTEIYDDADTLSGLGLSTVKTKPRVTAKGERLLALASELFAKNKNAMKYVESASRECAPLGFGDLKQKVYKQTVMIDGVRPCTIAEAPTGANVLSGIVRPSSSFSLDDDWADTLWAHFNYSDEDLAARSVIRPMVRLELAAQ
jgi:hypothetical protein